MRYDLASKCLIAFLAMGACIMIHSSASGEDPTVVDTSENSDARSTPTQKNRMECKPDLVKPQTLDVELLTSVKAPVSDESTSSGRPALFQVNSSISGKGGCKIQEGRVLLLGAATGDSAQKRAIFQLSALIIVKDQWLHVDGKVLDPEEVEGFSGTLLKPDSLEECDIMNSGNGNGLTRDLLLRQSCPSYVLVPKGAKGRVVVKLRK